MAEKDSGAKGGGGIGLEVVELEKRADLSSSALTSAAGSS